MKPEDVVETLPISEWSGGIPPELQRRAADALEGGKVLFFPDLPFRLEAAETGFLDQTAASGERKNVSLDPRTGKLGGAAYEGEEARALAAMLERFGQQATGFVRGLIPAYAAELERARTSFRPVEVKGRSYSTRHDDRLLHVDAFPTRPLAGRRILRLFSNIAPDGALREWRVGEPFADHAARFLPRIRAPLPGQAMVMNLLGLTKAPRTRYDHLMMGLHDQAKYDGDYQANGPRADVTFPPNSSWMVYTDQVLHAALGGRFALEQTFHLPVEAMLHPERTPLRVLERLTGRALV
ncbi:3-deoxy-D-manno-oct-2-ulosonic acid (Kdo) hydroxylase [Roseococcus sp. SYP-B2431]|uniref:Kdo hydroxylase family protein n=1 Tax=Roseococcus sp. SYP-B2431 TaxID=2496640 RepID=UPI00103FFD0B|nr:Kdo hydroxylase family protein [Roseococcus sp. SYP-B2431]TCH99776.1 3-deoxy-D-manno-oct-2-ulosonic acid (Kdo) hydroxylase [Roseococcus sp. SYP-B2431]